MCSSEQRRNQRASKAWKNVNESYKVATSERFGGSETTEPTGGLWNRWAVCVGSPDSRRLLEFEAPRVVLVVFFCLSPSFYICISLSFSLSLFWYTKCTVHARSTFATSSLLFLLFLLLLLLFLRPMAFLYYQPRLTARGPTAKRKRTTKPRTHVRVPRLCSCTTRS